MRLKIDSVFPGKTIAFSTAIPDLKRFYLERFDLEYLIWNVCRNAVRTGRDLSLLVRIITGPKIIIMLPDRKLNRLRRYDYRNKALYFVTSCIQTREHWLGEIADGKMHLNEYGKIADEQFEWLQIQFPYLQIHAHVVMPNHVHAIMEIISLSPVGTGRDLSAQHCDHITRSKIPDQNLPTLKIKSISELMGAYKTTTTKKIRQAGLPEFAWQRSFHDHIIRDEKGYQNIYHYIKNNPAKWQQDKFFTP